MLETPQPSTPQRPQDLRSRGRPSLYADRVLLLTFTAVLALDQLTKYLIRTNMALGESWPRDGALRLTYGTNTGTAFGLFPNQTAVLIVASVIAIGFLAYFYRAHAMPRRLLRFAIALQLGGAVGNLIDRLRVGSVVDFIDVGPWPIFNVADSSIVVGMALLIGVLLFTEAQSSRKPTVAGDADDGGR